MSTRRAPTPPAGTRRASSRTGARRPGSSRSYGPAPPRPSAGPPLSSDDEEDVMSDASVAARIEQLVAEEHELRTREQDDRSDVDELAADRERARAVEVDHDQCWDLLRQRRAIRDADGDPDAATVRDAATVEHYRQ